MLTPKTLKAHNDMRDKGKRRGALKAMTTCNSPRAKKVVVSLAPLKCLEKKEESK